MKPLTSLTLIFRNLAFYRRTHVWTVLGAMLSTAILVGALVIGDSVRESLKNIVMRRLGATEFALSSGDRYIRSDSAAALSEKLETPVAPLLMTRGIAIAGGGKLRVNNVQVAGFDKNITRISGSALFHENIAPDEAIINTHIADRLNLNEGDDFLLRINNLDYLPKDLTFALDSDTSLAKRFRVRAIASEEDFGGFTLMANQVTPATVFLSLDVLGRDMGLDNRSNVLLVGERTGNPLSLPEAEEAFRSIWSITDAGFELLPLPGRERIELRSERVFIDSAVVESALSLKKGVEGVFTYFVNEIRLEDRATPYSFVTALSGNGLDDDEIMINEWLADDLNAHEGDRINMSYYVTGPNRSLLENSAAFRVVSVVPIEGLYADRDLVPDFPGFADAENCRSWDTGIPLDLDRIRDKDEEYWDKYRATPKAFVSLNAARALWHNRFGDLTAIRFENADRDALESALSHAVDPASLGFFFRDVRAEGLRASSQSVGFDQLFLGLSFFIMVAAILLTGLLFALGIEERTEELGLLSALGFPKKRVRRLIVSEGIVLAISGSILGAAAGIFYNQLLLAALKSVWRDIVGTSSLSLHVGITTLVSAVLIAVTVNIMTMMTVAGNHLRRSVAELQTGAVKLESITTRNPLPSLILGVGCLIGVVVILVVYGAGNERELMLPFFAAGALFLTGGLAFMHYSTMRYADNTGIRNLSMNGIGIRNILRKKSRSLAVVGLLAIGIFIVFTVGANRRNAGTDAEKRASGTGGFALYGETVIPLLYDLNSEKGREFYSLNSLDSEKVRFVSFRVREGDDASCLNLNRVSNPRLAGVDPEALAKRGSFTFVTATEDVDPENPWDVLKHDVTGDIIPGIADQTVIVWGLGKAVGDTLQYVDERGNTYRIKLVGGLANSIFQGAVIISEKAFLGKYPSISGTRMFLADAPSGEIEDVSSTIAWALEDQGLDLINTAERLARFNQVENTYLSIFLILGTFGLLIGSVGIGIVIARNVSERRGELAVLQAVGFKRRSIQSLILSEHTILMLSGIAIGGMSAVLASVPALTASGSRFPLLTIVAAFVAVILNGIFWAYSATSLAAGKDFLPALRNE